MSMKRTQSVDIALNTQGLGENTEHDPLASPTSGPYPDTVPSTGMAAGVGQVRSGRAEGGGRHAPHACGPTGQSLPSSPSFHPQTSLLSSSGGPHSSFLFASPHDVSSVDADLASGIQSGHGTRHTSGTSLSPILPTTVGGLGARSVSGAGTDSDRESARDRALSEYGTPSLHPMDTDEDGIGEGLHTPLPAGDLSVPVERLDLYSPRIHARDRGNSTTSLADSRDSEAGSGPRAGGGGGGGVESDNLTLTPAAHGINPTKTHYLNNSVFNSSTDAHYISPRTLGSKGGSSSSTANASVVTLPLPREGSGNTSTSGDPVSRSYDSLTKNLGTGTDGSTGTHGTSGPGGGGGGVASSSSSSHLVGPATTSGTGGPGNGPGVTDGMGTASSSRSVSPLPSHSFMSDRGPVAPGKDHHHRASVFSFISHQVIESTLPYGSEIGRSVLKERVSNFFAVPHELEKVLILGFFVCLEAFLFLLTTLPLRLLFLGLKLGSSLLTGHIRQFSMTEGQKHDILRALVMFLCCVGLAQLDISALYHYIRAQHVLKLYVIFNMLEIFDKLFCSFGQDIMDSLFASSVDQPVQPLRIGFFFALATGYTFLHSLALLMQVVAISVSINSTSSSLLTLLVSNQFIELKSSVFKRFARQNLFMITCSDMGERLQMLMFLLFVIVQNFSNVAWAPDWDSIQHLCLLTAAVWCSEIFTDWLKHAFITKFNHITPHVYAKFRTIILNDVRHAANANQAFGEHSLILSRRIGFLPIPLACIAIRIMQQHLSLSFPVFVVWLLNLLAVKVLIGLHILSVAATHRSRFESPEEASQMQMWQGRA